MKKAFTLAEVLITLVVIGIVAAITINIIFNNQEEAYKTALKKNFSAIQNAFRNAAYDNGGFIPVDYEDGTQAIIDNVFKKYMRVAMDCGTSNCFKGGKSYTISNYIGKPTTTIFDSARRRHTFILQDGSFYSINIAGSGSNGVYTLDTVFIIVDVNGLYKGPNRWGKDVFELYYRAKQEKLIPGGEGSGWSSAGICDKTSTSVWNGIGCADLIIRGQKLPK